METTLKDLDVGMDTGVLLGMIGVLVALVIWDFLRDW